MSLSLMLCRKALELSGTGRSAAIDITTKCRPSTPSTPSVALVVVRCVVVVAGVVTASVQVLM